MNSDLTQEQLKKLIYDEEYKKKRAEAEQKAIDGLMNREFQNRYQDFGQCARCGRAKQRNNIPMCPDCVMKVQKALDEEDKSFAKLEHFAGMNNMKKKQL